MDEARYDPVADWYDSRLGGDDHAPDCTICTEVRELDDHAPGLVVDLGCGTGAHHRALQRDDRVVLGVDISRQMLRIAGQRLTAVVVADARQHPLRAASAALVVSTFVHTDVPSAAALFTSIHDLLRPGGTAVVVGAHPCFNNPFFGADGDGRHVLHPGYRAGGFFLDGPGLGDGIRSKVGVHHLPLGDYLSAVAASGLCVEAWREDDRDPPFTLSFRARRSD